MEFQITKKHIDWWIECAGLEEELSVFSGAIEIDSGYSGKKVFDKTPSVDGTQPYNEIGYRVLAKLLFIAMRDANKWNGED